MKLFAFLDVMVKDLRDFLLIGLLDYLWVFIYFLGLVLGMKVSDENVLIHLSTLGEVYHVDLLEFESAPRLKKL
jgi:hypothetical protein